METDCPVELIRVSKLDDGTVHSVYVGAGGVTEAFYQPGRESSSRQSLDRPSCWDHEDHRAGCCDGLNWFRLVMVVFHFVLYFGTLVFFIVALNPYFLNVPKIRPSGGLVPNRIVPVNPAAVQLGCYDHFFCEEYDGLPTIVWSNIEVYPNFTNNKGEAADYGKVLAVAFGVIVNESCFNFNVTTLLGKVEFGRNSTLLEETRHRIRNALFLLKYNCHPEALQATMAFFHPERYGVDLKSYLPKEIPLPCDAITGNLSSPYKRRHPEVYSTCRASNFSDYWDEVDRLVFYLPNKE